MSSQVQRRLPRQKGQVDHKKSTDVRELSAGPWMEVKFSLLACVLSIGCG